MTGINESTLLKLLDRLKEKVALGDNITYTIPEMWNSFAYNGSEKKYVGKELISVNPYRFYSECISKMILPNAKAGKDYSLPLSKILPNDFAKRDDYIGGDWISRSTIYAMHVRTSTAWDHDTSGDLELINKDGFKDTGTFLKSMALLPLLKEMGIKTVYLLPVCKNSNKYAKGEMGSPYAVKNYTELDMNLKDPMLGDDFSIDDEFRAFVEACHIMNMSVFIDVPPRTAARDSELIIDHPDWFYWIRVEEEEGYGPPRVVFPKVMPEDIVEGKHYFLDPIYESPDVKKHLKKFSASPDKLDPQKWLALRESYLADPTQDLLDLIMQQFGLTTAAAFPDMPGDSQPPWTDVTFLQLYTDHPVHAANYLEDHTKQVPYILYDVIYAREYKGKVRNEALWNLLADIIPSYQQRFGVDGARIDMGHVLPKELEQLMIQRSREVDPEFCIIAEVLHSSNAFRARESDYNMIVGEAWELEPNIAGWFNDLVGNMPNLPLPLFACAETPDTPRTVSRKGERKLSKLIAVLNNFLPNGVPFISSGFEICEKQPMNTGLGAEEGAEFVLPENDPMYGKLAFFDRCFLHWTQDGNRDVYDILVKIAKIREEYLDTITDATTFLPVNFGDTENPGVGSSYIIKGKEGQTSNNVLLVVANTDFELPWKANIDLGEIRGKSGNTSKEATLLYSEFDCGVKKIDSFDAQANLSLMLEPGEIKVILL